jgi:hypothetical protein
MHEPCACRRETAPIPGTMESAVRFVIDPNCPTHAERGYVAVWRDRNGRRVDVRG